jgi:hypothetical protein
VTRLFDTPGFPIRTSPGQRSVGNSPELFAATHVLHRLSTPRHPPHALSSLLTYDLADLVTPKRHRKPVGTRDRGPGPRSSRQTRTENFLTSTQLKQNLLLTLRMHFSKIETANLVGVELIGIEPTTSSLQSWRSPS